MTEHGLIVSGSSIHPTKLVPSFAPVRSTPGETTDLLTVVGTIVTSTGVVPGTTGMICYLLMELATAKLERTLHYESTPKRAYRFSSLLVFG